LEKTLALEPGYSLAHTFLALSYGLKSDFENCLTEYQTIYDLLPSSAHLTGLGLGYAIAGRRDEARSALGELEDETKHDYVSPVSLAQIYLTLGEEARALACLERACEEHDPWSMWNKVNPIFEPIRQHPRFKDLLRRSGLST